jgi:hypothetical protein
MHLTPDFRGQNGPANYDQGHWLFHLIDLQNRKTAEHLTHPQPLPRGEPDRLASSPFQGGALYSSPHRAEHEVPICHVGIVMGPDCRGGSIPA